MRKVDGWISLEDWDMVYREDYWWFLIVEGFHLLRGLPTLQGNETLVTCIIFGSNDYWEKWLMDCWSKLIFLSHEKDSCVKAGDDARSETLVTCVMSGIHWLLSNMIDGLLKQIDRLLKQIGGLLKQIDGLLKQIDGFLKQIDGLLKQIDGLLKQIDWWRQ
jgi:hypothetical protein